MDALTVNIAADGDLLDLAHAKFEPTVPGAAQSQSPRLFERGGLGACPTPSMKEHDNRCLLSQIEQCVGTIRAGAGVGRI
jgi:hypothetical protein